MLNEQQLEERCMGWFQEAGWHFAHGPDIAPDSSAPERTDYRQVVLRESLLSALARINPHMPPAALEQAINRVLQTGASSGADWLTGLCMTLMADFDARKEVDSVYMRKD